MLVLVNPRDQFRVQPDKVWLSIDYSSQELMLAAAISKDPAFVRAFTEPETLVDKKGKEYPNPYADLHTLSAVKCIDPKAFVGVSESEWVNSSKKNGSRKNGKILNFASIFLSTPQSIAEGNFVKLATAEEWCNNHQQTYAGYYQWADEYGEISAARGFAISPVSRCIRYVDEANAKGAGESPQRLAVNFAINLSGLV